MSDHQAAKLTWRERLYIIIFEADTPLGKAFDVALLVAIILSVVAVMMESVESFQASHGPLIYIIEWLFTILFTLEYIARILVAPNPRKYIFSFFGIIDLLSILPTFLSLIIVGAQSLLILRSLRLLRVFRVLKMVRFLGEASQLRSALQASQAKITVFIGAVFTMTVIMGTLMYMIEGGENGFSSIPQGIYWAVVTLTTVGYGDIAPQTVLGQTLATIIMILGYGIIAVPTGIVSAEMVHGRERGLKSEEKECFTCHNRSHDKDALYCKRCGSKL